MDERRQEPVSGRPPTEAEWQALLARQAIGRIYGVRTTGIACRFGCASRVPLRRNVVVFDLLGQAQAAGFRACKRCGADV